MFFSLVFVCLISAPRCQAAVAGKEAQDTEELPGTTDWRDSISLDEVEQAFDELQGGEGDFSFSQYVDEVMSGQTELSLQDLWQRIWEQICSQFEGQKNVLFRILALGLVAGIFMNFSGSIGDKNLGEIGFYITFTVLFATMSAGFYSVYEVAGEAVGSLLEFMKVLIPSFSLTLCLGAGSGTSIAYYETMLIAISLIEMVMVNVLLPGVQVYYLVSMVNQLSDNHFSKMAELIRSFLRWSIKILFGVLIGYQGIQGMLLPVMDKVKNNTILQTAKGLPGIGSTMGSLADTILGSGMLIKSAVGVGGLLCIVVLCFYPLMKLLVFTVLYRVGGAIVQPVSDRRIVAVLQAAAESGRLLMMYLFAGALMFILSITIILVCTNLT